MISVCRQQGKMASLNAYGYGCNSVFITERFWQIPIHHVKPS